MIPPYPRVYLDMHYQNHVEIVDRGPPVRTAFVHLDEGEMVRGNIPYWEVRDILESRGVW